MELCPHNDIKTLCFHCHRKKPGRGSYRVRVKYRNREIFLGYATTKRGAEHWRDNWYADPKNTTYEEWVARHKILNGQGTSRESLRTRKLKQAS